MIKKVIIISFIVCSFFQVKAQKTDTLKQASADSVYTQADVQPQFPGGANEFSRYLAMTLRYPRDARERHLTGRAIVKMIVEKDGTVSNVSVVSKVARSLEMEAIRVTAASPKWQPGTINNKPVRVVCYFPILFTL